MWLVDLLAMRLAPRLGAESGEIRPNRFTVRLQAEERQERVALQHSQRRLVRVKRRLLAACGPAG